MNELIGNKIDGLWMIGQHTLVFDTRRGPLGYVTDGECCSETWFADIIGVDCLLGGTVVSVEDLPLDDYNTDDGRGTQEVDRAYGHKITTEKGSCDVVYRNSSNGYYGGSISFCAMSDMAGAKAITADWRSE